LSWPNSLSCEVVNWILSKAALERNAASTGPLVNSAQFVIILFRDIPT
jgi:hypothetical protein